MHVHFCVYMHGCGCACACACVRGLDVAPVNSEGTVGSLLLPRVFWESKPGPRLGSKRLALSSRVIHHPIFYRTYLRSVDNWLIFEVIVEGNELLCGIPFPGHCASSSSLPGVPSPVPLPPGSLLLSEVTSHLFHWVFSPSFLPHLSSSYPVMFPFLFDLYISVYTCAYISFL